MLGVSWRLGGSLCLLLSIAACREKPRFAEAQKLGGQEISAEVLNRGYEAYTHYCYACHGEKGDGNGPSAPGMRPPPRDFTSGNFKFAGVAAGELPNDDDLAAVIKNGLAGTPMLPWDIEDHERQAIVQYIKTFSPRWKTETPGERVKPDDPNDPWAGKEIAAIELGKKLYHLTGVEMDPATQQMKMFYVGCVTCHPAYVSKDELTKMSMAAFGKAPDFRVDMYRSELKESEYKVGDKKVGIMPTDFLFHRIKTGTSPLALFRTIAAGIGGTAMPTFKGSVKDEHLWALAHYVKSLADLRGTPEGMALQSSLLRQNP